MRQPTFNRREVITGPGVKSIFLSTIPCSHRIANGASLPRIQGGGAGRPAATWCRRAPTP